MLGQLQLHYPFVLCSLLLYSCVVLASFFKIHYKSTAYYFELHNPPMSGSSYSRCMGFS